MTLNVVVAVILRYFTELVYDVVVKQLYRFQNLLLIVYVHTKTICTTKATFHYAIQVADLVCDLVADLLAS